MNNRADIPDLTALRRWFGRRIGSGLSKQAWESVRPGKLRKSYGIWDRGERWFYEGAFLQTFDQRSLHEIAALTDKRTLEELVDQTSNALNQIMYRATSGDSNAIKRLAMVAQGLVRGLEQLSKFDVENVRTVAETFSTWPVNLSLNPQEVERAKEHLKLLRVGTSSVNPTGARQRVDPRNFWTRLAHQAQIACQINHAIIPILLSHCAECMSVEHRKERLWGTPFSFSIHVLNNRDVMVIADWQRSCARLSEPISNQNFSKWWQAVKLCVLQHWKITSPRAYDDALRNIGNEGKEEWQRRNLAIGRIKQAFRSLTGLQ